ncbi:glycoside hydrolase family 3 protein [Nocardioides sp. CER19]|uniref:glycoside hydrolase family 3 protein n=1 Tax=Nocardioides sp. CER19 TaxID=3038538 RepID=UPI002449509C|nr:glycoside hydrolase family 3 protein [Nocardioides sp. CER19]MDH2416904.1 glycoside hydrolase family 3 protein [Nocardioides sp. CER19]
MLSLQQSHHRPIGRRRSRKTRLAVLSATTAATLGLAFLATPTADAHHATRHDRYGHHSHHSQHSHGPAYLNPKLSTKTRVADLLGRMTLAEKIGQMTQAERIDIDANPSLITTYGLGSILSGGGSTPAQNNAAGWADMVDRYQRAALATRLGIPMIYGVDSVHGHGNMQGATVFPHNIGLGATRDPKLVEKIGHVTAIETRASGVPWVFAPCICVARDDRWGRTYESFGEDPKLVESMETVIDGLQGHPGQLDQRDHVLATAKHFAGDGLTTYDASKAGTGAYPIDQGVDHVTRAEFEKYALSVYKPAIKRHHVGSVMPSFSSVDFTDGLTDGQDGAVKMHANRELITGWLKGQQHFDGFVISDWRAIRQLPGDYTAQVKTSVLAGVDMFMEPIQAPNNPNGWDVFIPTLTGLVNSGQVPISRIDDAVSRILTAKFNLGLFEHPFTDRSLQSTVGDAAHHALARRAAAESQVLLKNSSRTLPLHARADRPVYVAGSNANNIGNQAGGWTLTWQGGSTNVIPGTTILDGIKQYAPGATYSADASAAVPSNAAGVVVVGETPYAEGFGDVGGPQWAYDPGDHGVPRQPQTMQLSAADRTAIDKVCSQAASCTVLVVSGRPIILPPEVVAEADAIVASWLPGSEGAGVADDLFGTRAFTGKLPVTWPRTLDQEPINVGDANYDPLYPFGWGLTTRRR